MGWMPRMGSRAQFPRLAAAVLLLALAARLSAQAPEISAPATPDMLQNQAVESTGDPTVPSFPIAVPSRFTPSPPSGQTTPVVGRIAAPGQAPAPAQDAGQAGASTPRLGPGFQAEAGSARGPGKGNFPGYKDLRYEEDYTYLYTKPGLRTDIWDPIKFMPLWWLDPGYLSVGGEVRDRSELAHDEGFGGAPADRHGNNGSLLERYLLHADLHWGPFYRFFGQLQSGLEDGRAGGTRPDIDRDPLAVHQAFFDLILPFGDLGDSLTWRIGRQEMSYGSGRLIDPREGVNLRRSFDEFRLLLKEGRWEVDGWWGKPVRNRPGVFDDDPNPDVSFWGIYAVGPFPVLPRGNVDLYYLGFENKQAVYDQGPGYELRHSLGTRLWGRPLPWEYNLEYVWQFGTFGQGTIMAWTAANAVRYNFELPLKPRFGVRADVASGDNNPNTPNLQTFNPLFPSGAYFSLGNPLGPSNIIDLHPVFDVHLTEKVMLIADWDFFWRESLGDGLYTFSGTPLRPAGPSDARFVGSSPSLTLTWSPTRHVTFLASYVHFFAGPFLKETPPGKDIDYFTAWIDYKF